MVLIEAEKINNHKPQDFMINLCFLGKPSYLKHEFGCFKEMVGFLIQFHCLQSFILLKKM